MFHPDQHVHHPQFGAGAVILDQGETVIVRFGEGIESCEAAALSTRLSLAEAVRLGRWSPPLDVTLKAQAAAIRSLNDAWGVFSRSHIDLLPHQLWVCYRALQQWPLRLLIADDVGLGKTIEAGLILSALLASGKVRRVLILTPAGLVEQWQYRLKSLFDIRLSLYRPEVDRPRADFWSVHNQVVASLPTMRLNRGGRHERLLDADAWDLLIVDEAHHLNADPDTSHTLGFRLVEQLVNQGKVTSCLFFTGTPHRGKPFGFWSLMSLLRPDLFSPRVPDHEQLPHLRTALIRNHRCNPSVVAMPEGFIRCMETLYNRRINHLNAELGAPHRPILKTMVARRFVATVRRKALMRPWAVPAIQRAAPVLEPNSAHGWLRTALDTRVLAGSATSSFFSPPSPLLPFPSPLFSRSSRSTQGAGCGWTGWLVS